VQTEKIAQTVQKIKSNLSPTKSRQYGLKNKKQKIQRNPTIAEDDNTKRNYESFGSQYNASPRRVFNLVVSRLLNRMPRWFQGPRCLNTLRLDSKVVVITGANTGIGKETARELSRRGAEVVMACRDLQKAEEAAKEISAETKNKVTTLKLDLASLSSVRIAAKELIAQQPKIHILINNAGVMVCPKWQTEDGFEMQLGVNHLGHFLWTMLLLDTIKQSAPARIINLSSVAHEGGQINFDDIMMDKNYDATRAYCRSKLANILFTKSLAKRLEGTGVTTYAVHPGVVQTELGRHLGESTNRAIHDSFHFFGRFFFKTAEMGAQTSVYCATEESVIEQSGSYFSDCAVKTPNRRAEDMDVAERLWKLSEQLVNYSHN